MGFLKVLLGLVAFVASAAVAFVELAPVTATRFALAAERSRSGLVVKEALLEGGDRYVYLEGGRGEPLMLLHGFGADKDNFTRVARFLTSRYRVIIPDHIGFGESAHPPEADYSATAQADRLHALARHLGITRIHLGGSSMGGHIALSYAAAHPDEVASLWLISPGGIWSAPLSELATTIRDTGRNPLMARSPDEYAAVADFVMHDPPFIPRPMLDVMALERIRNFDLEQRIFAQLQADKLEERIRGLPTPSLIVWGREDRALHVDTAGVLHGLLPNSKVLIMEDIGHLPMIEAPERSAEDYLRFRATSGETRRAQE